MARAFLEALRQRVINAYENHEITTREIAKHFAVGNFYSELMFYAEVPYEADTQ